MKMFRFTVVYEVVYVCSLRQASFAMYLDALTELTP